MDTLKDAVRKQLAIESDTEFADVMRDVSNHGGNTGYRGFTSHAECEAFYLANRIDIVKALGEDATQAGTDALTMVAQFRCLVDNDVHTSEVLAVIAGDVSSEDSVLITSALAWYALERVASEVTA